ncbi:hypothetical protein PCANC_17136 [Puccinia coronata f. sp. avenae]|uniref:Uncharacterized protein n=1 Tax=Puccinia coronata f. sp. avenae TaxID=200324 RepID=A0A2N5U1C6_9BASI|nr:hypothetical protein PCANC_17136 [Puccinia coronata f. sp. avenae]
MVKLNVLRNICHPRFCFWLAFHERAQHISTSAPLACVAPGITPSTEIRCLLGSDIVAIARHLGLSGSHRMTYLQEGDL